MKITISSEAAHKGSLLFTVKHTTHPHRALASHNNISVYLNFREATLLPALSLSLILPLSCCLCVSRPEMDEQP